MSDHAEAVTAALAIMEAGSTRFAWHLKERAEVVLAVYSRVLVGFNADELQEAAYTIISEYPDSNEWTPSILRAEAAEVRRKNRQLRDQHRPLVEEVPEEERISPEKHAELCQRIRELFNRERAAE